MNVRLEKLLVSVAMQAVIGFVFVFIEQVNGARSVLAPAWLTTPLDDWLTASPWAVWPYLSWYAMPIVLLSLERQSFRRVSAAVLLAFLACAVGYLLLPVAMDRPGIDGRAGLSAATLGAVYAIDHPRNIFPSFHAALCGVVLGATAGWPHRRVLVAWVIAICVSCVLTKQHYALDVIAGLAIGRSSLAAIETVLWVPTPLAARRPTMSQTQSLLRLLAPAAIVAVAALASATPPPSFELYRCDPDAPDSCCTDLDPNIVTSQVCKSGVPLAATQRNLLLIVSDDNGYCHHGFMQGMCTESSFDDCSNNGGVCWGTSPALDPANAVDAAHLEWCVQGRCIKPCLSNNGCDPSAQDIHGVEAGSCWSTKQFYDHTTLQNLPLRLSDPSCRSRFPIKAPGFEQDPDHGFFPFSRTTEVSYQGVKLDSHMVTPHIDSLASQGTLFPRAYTGGQRCQPGRTVLWHGLANVHLKEGNIIGKFGRHCALEPENASGTLTYDTDLAAGLGCYLHNLTSIRPYAQKGGIAEDGDYRTFLFGKEDIVGTHPRDFDSERRAPNSNIGGVNTKNCEADCQTRIREARVPFDSDDRTVAAGIEGMFDRIEKYMGRDGSGAPAKPVLMWYAPNIPHDQGAAPIFLKNWYPDIQQPPESLVPTNVKEHFARVSRLDIGVGALVDGLKRRCTCRSTTPPKAESLWDNTVVIFVNDNGNFLPDSKRWPTENGDRTPIIVSEPGHRNGSIAPDVRFDDLPSGMDVIQTFVSYAQEAPTHPTGAVQCGSTQVRPLDPDQLNSTFAFKYPFTRNLCPIVRDDQLRIRSLYMTNLSLIPEQLEADTRMLVTRPGELGVCLNGSGVPQPNATYPDGSPGHARLCRIGQNGQCATANGYTCQAAKRCGNRPDKACSTDADCACIGNGDCPLAWCRNDGGGPTCHNCVGGQTGDPCCPSGPTPCPPYPVANQYPEFNGRKCPGGGGDCIPAGVCQQPILRLITDRPSGGTLRHRLYDSIWDPDENIDLFATGGVSYEYISSTLKNELVGCLNGFWDLRRHSEEGFPGVGQDPGRPNWQAFAGCAFPTY